MKNMPGRQQRKTMKKLKRALLNSKSTEEQTQQRTDVFQWSPIIEKPVPRCATHAPLASTRSKEDQAAEGYLP